METDSQTLSQREHAHNISMVIKTCSEIRGLEKEITLKTHLLDSLKVEVDEKSTELDGLKDQLNSLRELLSIYAK